MVAEGSSEDGPLPRAFFGGFRVFSGLELFVFEDS